MIELSVSDEFNTKRQSSKGNQLKWEQDGIWYKADYTGYEGLAEYVVSNLLMKSDLKREFYASYSLEEIRYKHHIYTGAKSASIIQDDQQIITLERLYKNQTKQSLTEVIWKLPDAKSRLSFLVEEIERITGLTDFGRYMSRMMAIDAFFLNEDRHMHNIAVFMDGVGTFSYCPYFDHGAALLSDIAMDYPLGQDTISLMEQVKGKTISTDFEEALDVAETLYGSHIRFLFSKADVERLLDGITLYDKQIIARVKEIVFQQMRKYEYLVR